jgi:hypothetical protein
VPLTAPADTGFDSPHRRGALLRDNQRTAPVLPGKLSNAASTSFGCIHGIVSGVGRPPESDIHGEDAGTALLHRYRYTFRTAASAAVASAVTASKNAGLWPSNRPDFTNPVAAATAPAILLFRGLITEQRGKLGSMNVQG